MTDAPPAGSNPYVGPRAFQRGECLYGRDREVMELLDLLIAERIVLLYSPSGAGKTSLIEAALVPELVAEGFEVLPPMRVSLELPRGTVAAPTANRYAISLLLSLEAELPPEQQLPLAELSGLTLADYLDRRRAAAGRTESIVLILDQFEEILTANPTDRPAKAEFFAQLGVALRDRQRWALFAMREEYVAGLDPYLSALPTRLATTYRLQLLGVEQAKEAIRKPAGSAGVEFTAAAADRLTRDLATVRLQQPDGKTVPAAGDFVEPVQLQVVCRRLWDTLPPGTVQILETDVQAKGDVDSALAGYYAEQVEAIAASTGVPEQDIREWIDRQLIIGQGVRGQVLQEPEESKGLDNRAIWPLVDGHLVRAERRGGATWFELTHDRLIEPVRADNAAWREANLSPLQRRAALWEEQDKPEGLLLHGAALAEARAWAAAHPVEPGSLERRFIDESVKAGRLRSAKRLRFMLLGAAVIVILLSALAIFAWTQAEEAQQQRAVAVTAGQQARSARDAAIAAEGAAVIDRQNAIVARDTALAAQGTSEAERQAAGTARADAESGLSSALTALAVAEDRQAAVKALEATNQVLVARLTPTATSTPGPGLTPVLPPGRTPGSSPTPTSTPTPNQQATAAAEVMTAQAILRDQLAQVRAEQTAVARCPFVPSGEFSQTWKTDEIRGRIGCPTQPSPIRSFFAEQPFERGYMYWSESPELFIVIIGDDIGSWFLFREKDIHWTRDGGLSCQAQVPPGLFQPIRGFGGLWCANPEIQKKIGFATAAEFGVNDNLLQEFERGLMLRDSRNSILFLFADRGTYVRDMVLIPGGQFDMGSPRDQGQTDEHPQSSVAVSGFWLDRFEVTNAEYRECVAAGFCAAPHRGDGTSQPNSATRRNYYTEARFDRFPVIFVSWSDARTYCQWAGKRLPTEAEWEWAAKGSGNSLYPWGSQAATPSLANYGGNTGDTREVGAYGPSALGLYDMAGNVWEWTSSLYEPYPYRPDDGREYSSATGRRVLRGGSWRDGPDNLRAVNRDAGTEPDFPLDNVGFRCARSPD